MIYFIVNSASRTGRGKASWQQMSDELKKYEIEYKAFLTKYEGHATKLAEQISSLPDEDICMVVVGGDGTINEVINGIRDYSRVRFAVIPNGSGNDFVRGMKAPTDPLDAIQKIVNIANLGKEAYSPIDLGRVSWDGNERLFGISSGVGLDAIVTRDVDASKLKKILNFLHMGSLTYVLLTIYTLFKMDTAEVDMTLEAEDGTTEEKHFEKLIFMATMNQFAEGGGVPMAPKASCRDGLLSFSSALGIPKWRTFFCLPFLVAAKHTKIKGFDVRDGKKATIKISKPFVLHTDGESLGEVSEVEYEVLEGVLKYME